MKWIYYLVYAIVIRKKVLHEFIEIAEEIKKTIIGKGNNTQISNILILTEITQQLTLMQHR